MTVGAAGISSGRGSLPSPNGAAHGRNIGALLFKTAYRTEILGADSVPRRGRLIVAANHIGFLDGPLLFAAAPRPLHLVAKSEIFAPPLDRLLAGVGQIPLIYDSPDRAAVGETVRVLEHEQAVGIFPEAHRGLGDFSRMRHGIAYLTSRTNAPICPAAIFGTRVTGMPKNGLPKLRSRLTVAFGKPFEISVPGDPRKRSVLAAMGEEIRQRLSDHVLAAAARIGAQLPTDDTALATEQNLAAARATTRAH